MTIATPRPTYVDYGRDFADIYDTIFPSASVTESQLDWISAHIPTGNPRVLELGVGTGRIAVPLLDRLTERGDDAVYAGIEISEQMLEVLLRREPQRRIHLMQGDMVTAPYGEDFDTLLCACATISMITDPVDQQAVFAKAAAALKPGGTFIVETHHAEFVRAMHATQEITYAVPYPGRRQALVSFSTLKGNAWHIDHCWIDDGSSRFVSEESRTTTLFELDAYAAAAGLTPVSHSGGLDGAAITPSTGMVTAVYRKAAIS